jgi:transcriptional regulator with XRE-family HTH domain
LSNDASRGRLAFVERLEARPVGSPELGNALKAARKRRAWSRETLAHHAGMSWAAIAQIEAGRRKDVRISSLRALAKALGITIDELAEGRERSGLQHSAVIFASDQEFIDRLAPAIREAIADSQSVHVVTQKSRGRALRDLLGSAASEASFIDWNDWYTSPMETLNKYRRVLEDDRRDGRAWSLVIGEPVWAERSRREVRAWTRYEAMLNISLAACNATIICPYDSRSVPRGTLQETRQTHPIVSERGTFASSGDEYQAEQLLLD